MRTIALKVDVDTFRGTREGVPRLVELFKKHNASATFLFSLGPDHTGWAFKRIFHRGFLKKVKRTSVLSHYGFKTLMYGVLLPGPNIGRRLAEEMRAVKQAGFEVGIHTYDHVYWQDNVRKKNQEWTAAQLEFAQKAFIEIFSVPAATHGAAGWQMNDYAFNWLERFSYNSDTRGTSPFFPVLRNVKSNQQTIMKSMQLPTTLPTIDEMLGEDNVNESNFAEHLLSLTEPETQWGHVYTSHAELEGQKLLPVFERFLLGAKKQGYKFISLKEYFSSLDKTKVNICPIIYNEIPGRSGIVCCQGCDTRP
ncbi:MAG: chitin deacetylase [Bdellovibrionales bacterium RBG_16_40_8]|nr:MAG: chitin deacetylase [Bdellovibrionales bacterium RBG_16_40_8]